MLFEARKLLNPLFRLNAPYNPLFLPSFIHSAFTEFQNVFLNQCLWSLPRRVP